LAKKTTPAYPVGVLKLKSVFTEKINEDKGALCNSAGGIQ